MHDGFTLADLVSYDTKHNEANGEDNRDGTDDNRSWNCGAEGPTDDPDIVALRARQQRAMLATLLLSFGVPLLLGGDELGRTQQGNNNAYCQDNPITWFDWSQVDTELLAFTRRLLALRKAHPVFRRRRFLAGMEASELGWYTPGGTAMTAADWADPDARAVALYLDGADDPDRAEDGSPLVDDDFLVLVNGWWEPLEFTIPPTRDGQRWYGELDTFDPTATTDPHPTGRRWQHHGRSPVRRRAPRAPVTVSQVGIARYGITIPFDGIPLHAHKEWFTRLREVGYTDLWTAEVDGSDGFTPLALAAAWEPELRLGVAITPAYTRGPALLAQSVASIADAAPGRFAFGLGASSEVIVAGWNGLAYENQYRRVRDTLRFLRRALTGEKITQAYEGFSVTGFRLARVPEQSPRSVLAALRPGMLRLAGREADGVILNWLGADDVRTSSGRVRTRRRHGQGGRRPHLRGPLRGRGAGSNGRAPDDHDLPERPRLRRVPALAGPWSRTRTHVGRLGGGRAQGGSGRHSRRSGG